MMSASTEQWLPAELIDAVRRAGPHAQADERFLLISLDGASDRLVSGLMAAGVGRMLTMELHTATAMLANSVPPPPSDTARSAEMERGVQQLLEFAGSRPGFLTSLDGMEEFTYGGRVAVGRSPDTDLVLRDNSVSRLHGWVERSEDGKLWLVDTGSKNGCFVNGEPVSGRVGLEVGDQIGFGRVRALLCSGAAVAAVVAAED